MYLKSKWFYFRRMYSKEERTTIPAHIPHGLPSIPHHATLFQAQLQLNTANCRKFQDEFFPPRFRFLFDSIEGFFKQVGARHEGSPAKGVCKIPGFSGVRPIFLNASHAVPDGPSASTSPAWAFIPHRACYL